MRIAQAAEESEVRLARTSDSSAAAFFWSRLAWGRGCHPDITLPPAGGLPSRLLTIFFALAPALVVTVCADLGLPHLQVPNVACVMSMR